VVRQRINLGLIMAGAACRVPVVLRWMMGDAERLPCAAATGRMYSSHRPVERDGADQRQRDGEDYSDGKDTLDNNAHTILPPL
jgi:hypothetical protein